MGHQIQKKDEKRLKNRSLFADSVIMGSVNDAATNDYLTLILGEDVKVHEFGSLGNDFVL